jgi:hypothetical protein|tara:strand:- start:201 stop:380 length:180 start_codon:yes stop_codon:yes gene_type:complete
MLLLNLKIKIMPTVKLPNGQKRTFPYNAVGKAQADSFAKMMKGKKKDNPGYGMEKKMGY